MEECDQGNTCCEEVDFEDRGHELRAEIKAVARRVKEYIQLAKDTTPTSDDSVRQNQGEMIANATLAYRHLESGAMRIGKSMQAYQGGTSILDKIREEGSAVTSEHPDGQAERPDGE